MFVSRISTSLLLVHAYKRGFFLKIRNSESSLSMYFMADTPLPGVSLLGGSGNVGSLQGHG